MKNMNSSLNFTPRIQDTLKISKKLALDLNNPRVNLDHFIYALFISKSPSVNMFLNMLEVDEKDFLESISHDFDVFTDPVDPDDIRASSGFNNVLKKAIDFANEMDHQYIGVEHLLYALLNIKKSPLVSAFKEFNISKKEAMDVLDKILNEEVSSKNEKTQTEEEVEEKRDGSKLKYLEKDKNKIIDISHKNNTPKITQMHYFVMIITNFYFICVLYDYYNLKYFNNTVF